MEYLDGTGAAAERCQARLGVSPPQIAQIKVWERYLDEQAILNIRPNDDDETTDLLLFISADEKEA